MHTQDELHVRGAKNSPLLTISFKITVNFLRLTCSIDTSFLSCSSCLVGNLSLSMTLIATSRPVFLCLPANTCPILTYIFSQNHCIWNWWHDLDVEPTYFLQITSHLPPYTVPNCPEPRISSGNIWYNLLISWNKKCCANQKRCWYRYQTAIAFLHYRPHPNDGEGNVWLVSVCSQWGEGGG